VTAEMSKQAAFMISGPVVMPCPKNLIQFQDQVFPTERDALVHMATSDTVSIPSRLEAAKKLSMMGDDLAPIIESLLNSISEKETEARLDKLLLRRFLVQQEQKIEPSATDKLTVDLIGTCLRLYRDGYMVGSAEIPRPGSVSEIGRYWVETELGGSVNIHAAIPRQRSPVGYPGEVPRMTNNKGAWVTFCYLKGDRAIDNSLGRSLPFISLSRGAQERGKPGPH